MTESLDPNLLTEQTRHLRKLALGLVGADDADDVVQDTLVRAIERPPRARSKLTHWMSIVLRNHARKRAVRDRRRREREARVARPEQDSGDDSSRFRTCARVVAAVDALPSKYREVITMRFFDELPPRAIAERLGVPVNTVRTRTARALERLRATLDAEHGGDRAAWMAVMVPFADPNTQIAAGTTAVGTGAIIVEAKTKLAVAGALVLGAGIAVTALFWNPARIEERAAERPEAVESARGRHVGSELVDPATDAADADLGSDPVRRTVTGDDWTLRGVARTADGSPTPAGVRLRVSAFDGLAAGAAKFTDTVTTEPGGSFAWHTEPPAETVTLVFESADGRWHCDDNRCVAVAGRQPPQHVRLELARLDRLLRGRVTDAEGRPVAGARLRAGIRSHARSDADGLYELAFGTTQDRVSVRAHAPGFRFHAETIDLATRDRVVAHDITLAPGFRAHGTVRDESGSPIAGATVYAFRSFSAKTTSDADGRFEISWIDPALTNEHLSVRHPLHRDASAAFDVRGESVEVDVVMTRGATCRGVVVTPAGEPVEGAFVYWRPEALNNDEPNGITDARGEFALTGGARYWDTLSVRAPGSGITFASLPGLAEAFDVDGIRIVVEPGRTISGVVRDPRETPIAGVAVFGQLGDRTDAHAGSLGLLTHTDADGRFELRDLPRDSITLSFVESGYVREHRSGLVGDRHDLHVVLEPAAGIAGTVVDASTNTPIETFAVRFVQVDTDPHETAITSYWAKWVKGLEFHDPHGHWSTREDEELEPGGVIGIQIHADGYAPSDVIRARATANPRPEDHVVRLVRGATLRGTVIRVGDRTPVEGARVYLLHAADEVPSETALAGAPLRKAATTADGAFEFAAAARGETRVVVTHPEYATVVDGPFVIPHGADTVERVILLHEGARITGRVIGADGLPRAGARVDLSGDDSLGSFFDHTTTDDDGRFEFSRLAAGEHRIAFAEPTERGHRYPLQRAVRVAARAHLEVDLSFREGTARIRGRVAFEESDLVVVLERFGSLDSDASLPGATLRLHFATDSEFRFDGLAPGVYEVRAQTSRGPFAERVRIESGEHEITLGDR